MRVSSTRRTLLAGLAVPAALATGCHALPAALPKYADAAIPAEPHPDADLLALGERWQPAYAEHEAACTRAGELEDIGLPEPPEAFFVAKVDSRLKLECYATDRPDGRRWYRVEPANAEWRGLRRKHWRWQRREAQPRDNLPSGGTHIEERVPWPEAQARADEIVAAFDGWKAARQAARDANGYTAAAAERARLGRIVDEIEDAILAARPRTLDGLAVQARAILGQYADTNDEPVAMLLRAFVAMQGGAT